MNSILKYLEIGFFTAGRYLIIAGIPFFIFYKLLFKRLIKSKIQERSATKKDFLREIKHSIESSFVLALMGFIVLFTPLRSHTLIYAKASDYPFWWMPISFLLALIIHDSYFYWMHRLLHHKKLFSKAHVIHHQSTNPSPWAAYSFHFFEAITEGLIVFIIVFTLPIHPIVLLMFTLIGFLINIYGHLGFEIMPKGFRNSFLFGIINTSVYHNLHHHKFRGNYGLYFRVWDRLLKTEHPDYVKEYDKIQAKRFGKPVNLKMAAMAAGLLLCISANAQIEGKWMSKETGDVVEIYKENNFFYAKAVASKNKTETDKLASKNIVVLSHFEKKNENNYCCGSIYLPRRKMTAAGSIQLLDKNTIKVKGHYGILSYSTLWTRT